MIFFCIEEDLWKTMEKLGKTVFRISLTDVKSGVHYEWKTEFLSKIVNRDKCHKFFFSPVFQGSFLKVQISV